MIRLLGGFAVLRDGVPLPGSWRTEKARTLVKLLALAPEHALRRDQVLEYLWPEHDPAAAANNLYFTLHAARRMLDTASGATTSLIFREGVLRLAPPGGLATDVAAFEAAAGVALSGRDAARYEDALARYVGELLPEDRYADWASGSRERLRETYLTLLGRFAELRAEREEWDAATALLGRVIQEDATREAAHVGLMRAFVASGQRGRALRQYAELRAVLRREVDAEPDATTQALYGTILAGGQLGAVIAPASPSAVGNVPAALTRFIGREAEIVGLGRLLTPGVGNDGSRLVTLTGSGGCGKSRLALEVARELAGGFGDGVWLVELAALGDPALVPDTVARALGVRPVPGQTSSATLVAALRPKALLLLLDNCEHLIAASAALAARLLASCPLVRVLATSREPLQIGGETIWRVPSLGVPPDTAIGAGAGAGWREALLGSEATRLLIDRIGLRRPDFVPNDEDTAAAATICRRLDGIPLALELAAGRVTHLTLPQIAGRLDNALGLLAGGGRSAPPRQQTLRATLEWSYDLLEPDERLLLSRLAICAGGCTLETVEAVCAGGAVPTDEVLDLLARLVDKSLVQVEEETGGVRYRLHEILRQFARERLIAGGEAAALAGRHGAYYLALAERAEPHIHGGAQREWVGRLTRDYQNLRAALAWAQDERDADAGLRLGNALVFYWYITWKLEEGREWLLMALALPGAQGQAHAHARATFGVGVLSWQLGDHGRMGEYLEAGLALARALGFTRLIAWSLVFLGYRALEAHRLDTSQAHAEEALALFRTVDDTAGLGAALQFAGNVAKLTGDYAVAAARYEERLRLDRANQHRFGIALAAQNLGYILLRQGRIAPAINLFRESYAIGLAIGKEAAAVVFVEAVAAVACLRDEPELAARFFGAAQAWNDLFGRNARDANDRYEAEHYLQLARVARDGDVFAAAWSAGNALPFDEAAAEARDYLQRQVFPGEAAQG